MKVRRMQLLGVVVFFLFSFLLFTQDKPPNHTSNSQKDIQKTEEKNDSESKFWSDILKVLIGMVLGGGVLRYIQYFRRKKDTAQKKLAELEAEKEFKQQEQYRESRTAEDIYRAALKEELGHIDLLGSPDIESKTVKLEDAFVSLCISEAWQSEKRFETREEMEEFYDRHLSPEQVMSRTFKKYRLLLIIGDPGSGKTTLLKYYAVSILNNKYSQFGFTKDVFPIYFPLRELDFNKGNNEPVILPQNLAKWANRHLLNISADQFHDWLHNRKTLVLLDGLDEISSKEQRRKVCRWVKDMCAGLKNAYFVVTSRSTGYRKLDGIELRTPHLRADIMDFSPDQQEVFLKKWFRAIYLSELPPEGIVEQEWNEKQLKLADQRSHPIIDFLKKEENKTVQELAAVPMLLQIMAIIWKDRKHLPDSRPALYDAALNYLLAYRDKEKEIEPLLPVEQFRRVLAPTSLWMQEDLKQDEAPKEQMHQTMQPILNTLTGQHNALVFCEHLRDRTGLISDYDKEHYIFRHRSFREFLAGIQLKEEAHKQKQKRIKTLVQHFKDDWWEETLRFFMSKADDEIFDGFMRTLFKSKVSHELNAHQQNLLQNLIKEAPQKKIASLAKCLNSGQLNKNQKRYILDCLKTIGTPDALKAIEAVDKNKLSKENISYAEDIKYDIPGISGSPFWIAEKYMYEKFMENKLVSQDSFRNPFENNVEYIKIPGGRYKFSVTYKIVTVPDLYFCKYPVTNKRYRRFISFLEGNEIMLSKKLPVNSFVQKLQRDVGPIKGYIECPYKTHEMYKFNLRSKYDNVKELKGDDQPVVGITWYAARTYCFWLSCLGAVINDEKKIEDVKQITGIYRLPTEEEWEWAAGGEPDGSIRKYPWSKDKGEPTPNHANYGRNVGATTPVGRYPEGATSNGLMDMAGNVWEWMENLSGRDRNLLTSRGGSWYDDSSVLRCSARHIHDPDVNGRSRDNDIGFRVVLVQS